MRTPVTGARNRPSIATSLSILGASLEIQLVEVARWYQGTHTTTKVERRNLKTGLPVVGSTDPEAFSVDGVGSDRIIRSIDFNNI